MKQIFKKLFIAVGLVLMVSSCYDEYKNDYEFSGTYFSMQSPLRNIIVEDDGTIVPIEFGAMLSGRYENTANETVDFEIDATMLNDTSINLVLLPEAYYELSNESQIQIPSGEKLGTVTVTIKEAFLNDPMAHKVNYALPIRIVKTSLDSILVGMDSTIIAVKYQNGYYGAYRVQGVDYTTDAVGTPIDTVAYTDPDFHQNAYTISGTLAMDTVTLPYIGKDVSGNNVMKLAVATDGSVIVSNHTVETGVVIAGTGSYDEANKRFTLDYTYTDKNGDPHEVMDTLTHFDVPMSLETWR